MSARHQPVVVLAGASGFLGTDLARRFTADGWNVKRIGRSGPDGQWGHTAGITRVLDGARLLVNLAGKSVDCRYTRANRAEILRSRVETTAELHRAVAAAATPPLVWMNASTATIYRHEEERANTEDEGVLGEGFSVEVARAWEAEFFSGETPGLRRLALRMTIVLGEGPATAILLRLARIGLGGPQFDGPWPSTRERREAGVHHEYRRTLGRQHFSWIHVEDVYRSILFLFLEESRLTGPVNLASPNPSDNIELSRLLRAAVGRRIGLPAPRFVLEPATFLLRTETELLLKSRWVVPARLEESGFSFAHPHLAEALRAVVASR
ncbi:epimerase [Rathayibacter iranicus]|uniref:NAD-dependent epimerase n=2 Tax=Rathayibacter iranicus TaxID=59737 RepID=A0AAD1AG34_9MICO|nr:DUF1731 domain-containing protein [Rathayibacter iranicus]AZZ57503.1 NAD-dependent epimerase [Rathayibacter iranicus]MWV31982.1 DUF1731 domain-containing protein [Rathayibacter iranicus NCPPB 2253 = VKM Ac-1602]PPI42873.1 NAD-dependent epimerase [Rathayibacter iranicus]PPI58137.1 NAD-dependent epimerase [Rathayibacter iranicus]PPI69033.1 NAD-dependent epimerase [Rathayibacter iranicus]